MCWFLLTETMFNPLMLRLSMKRHIIEYTDRSSWEAPRWKRNPEEEGTSHSQEQPYQGARSSER